MGKNNEEKYMGTLAPTIIPDTRYGNLVTTGVYIPNYMDGNKRIFAQVECKCDCGSITYKQLNKLKKGQAKSCGVECPYFLLKIHGHSIGKKKTKEYLAWCSMKERCDYPKHNRYQYCGGKGISYHESIYTFKGFLEVMGKAPSKYHQLTRIDKEGDFEPGNVHWYLPIRKKK